MLVAFYLTKLVYNVQDNFPCSLALSSCGWSVADKWSRAAYRIVWFLWCGWMVYQALIGVEPGAIIHR